MKPGTLVQSDVDRSPGVVIGEPNSNGMQKIALRDGTVRMVPTGKLAARSDQATVESVFMDLVTHLRREGVRDGGGK